MISLGIDIGGTGCKCVAFRDTGEQIAMSYREYPTKPGEVNLNQFCSGKMMQYNSKAIPHE